MCYPAHALNTGQNVHTRLGLCVCEFNTFISKNNNEGQKVQNMYVQKSP